MSGDLEPIVLHDHSRTLLDAARAVLATPGLPPVVLVGGLAVTMRISAAGAGHRATVDIDLVTIETEPEVVEVLAEAHQTDRHRLLIEGVAVDVIPTLAVDRDDLDGLEDTDRLFLAGHRWAFDEGVTAVLTVIGSEPLEVRVATAAGLVATKSHAIGYPSSRRRATKMPSDLLDLYRLVELYNTDGELSQELRTAPGGIARIVADIAEREILANPARATNKMASSSPAPIDWADVESVIAPFVSELREP